MLPESGLFRPPIPLEVASIRWGDGNPPFVVPREGAKTPQRDATRPGKEPPGQGPLKFLADTTSPGRISLPHPLRFSVSVVHTIGG
jgi:hypothetical protein